MCHPNDAKAYYSRGTAYYYLNQYERAIKDFDRAIELNPNDVKAYYNRGIVYYDLKQYGRAIKDFDRAIERNPNFAEAYEKRELALSKLEEQKPTQTPTPVVTETPTSTITTPIPTPPGFEAFFVIAGLLTVAFLINQNKKRKRK